MESTPLPWENQGIYIFHNTGQYMVAKTTYGHLISLTQAVVNAELICQAVNNHDDLLEALIKAIEHMYKLEGVMERPNELYLMIERVIAKATEKGN